MLWSKWKTPLAIVLLSGAAVAGLAWGQMPMTTPHATASHSDVYLTVAEQGKPAQKCRVLYCWTMNDGQTACQVQALDTGELITLVNPPLPKGAPRLLPDGAAGQQSVSQIFRYGKSKTCPPGFPQPPADVVQGCAPPRTPLLAGVSKWGKGTPAQPTVITVPVQSAPPPVHIVKPAPAPGNQVLANLAQATPPAPSKMIITPSSPPLPTVNTKPGNDNWTKLPDGKKNTMPPSTLASEVKPAAPVSKTVEPFKKDPLANPGHLIPDAAKKKLDLKTDPELPPSLTKNGYSDMPGHPGMNMQKPGSMGIGPNGLPLGSASANAAYNGMPLPVKYLPTPIVTVPKTAPPLPPPPEIPNAPQPVPYQNAFTPPEPPKGASNGFPNPMMTGNPYQYPNPMMMPPPPPGHGMSPPMMVPPPMHMAQGQPQMQGSPSNPFNVPRSYQGPLPPNPTGQQPLAQVALQQPGFPMPYAGHPSYQGIYSNPAMDRPGVPVTAPTANTTSPDTVYQMLTTLKTSLYPAQREWAAIHLSKCDWRNQPHLVQGLLTAAKEDAAPMVRIACIKTLVRIGVTRDVYAPTLQAMKADVDPRVRDAVDEALGTGTGVATQSPAAAPGLAPASHIEKK